MGRGVAAVILGAAWLAACSSKPDSADASGDAPKERGSAEAKPAPPADLDATVRFAALRMPAKIHRDGDLRADERGIALALDGERAAMVACGEGLTGETWLVARVTATGKVDGVEVVRSTGASKNVAACTAEIVKRIAFPALAHPTALSAWITLAPKEPAPPPRTEPAPSASAAPPSRADCASDYVRAYFPACTQGDMWGDGAGKGGLGLTGIGEGGDTRGEGIGLGSIGTIGGSGRPTSGSHGVKPPQVRMGATKVSGRLPAEVIQRIVRQNFGRFRLCYENSLRMEPELEGSVTVAFTIDPQGAVSSVSHTTTMKDDAVGKCVQRAFSGLSFPQPEGGVVQVTYPISFAPGSVRKLKTADAVAGIPLEKLDGPTLAEAVSKAKGCTGAGSVSSDPASEVPFVVFVDIGGDHYSVTRVPAESLVYRAITNKQFGVVVTRAGTAKDDTTFLD